MTTRQQPVATKTEKSGLKSLLLASADGNIPLALLFLFFTVALFAVALFFRIWRLSYAPGLNGDEAWSGNIAWRFINGKPFLWQTTSGNFLNPFWLLPVWILHLLFAPSALLLRSVSVISGCAALIVNFYLARRVYKLRLALLSTFILAVLPINIGFSRLAADPAQVLLFSLPILYLPLWAIREPQKAKRNFAACAVVCASSFLVHPTLVFCYLWLFVAIIWHWISKRHLPRHSNQRNVPDPAKSSKANYRLGALLFLTFLTLITTVRVGAWQWSRPLSLEGLFLFSQGMQRLFTGATMYRATANLHDSIQQTALWPTVNSVASPENWKWLDALGFCGVFVLLAAFLVQLWANVRQMQRQTKEDTSQNESKQASDVARYANQYAEARCDAVLFCCLLASVLPFYWGVGHLALQPGRERYALWLIAPGALIGARGFQALWETVGKMAPRHGRKWEVLLLGSGLWATAFLLFNFYTFYFEYFAKQFNPQHSKIVALHAVLKWHERQKTKTPVWILSADWWIYQPLRYLTLNRADVNMVPYDYYSRLVEFGRKTNETQQPLEEHSVAYEDALRAGQVWFIGFANKPETIMFISQLRRRNLTFQENVRPDKSENPEVIVIHVLASHKQRATH